MYFEISEIDKYDLACLDFFFIEDKMCKLTLTLSIQYLS